MNGIIINESKFKQGILFRWLREDPKDLRTGTDIDFSYEGKVKDEDGKFIRNDNGQLKRVWLMGEVKEYGKAITRGQEILFENFCNNMKGGYECYALLLWHREDSDKDIYIKDCIVAKLYHNGKWSDVIAKRGEVTFKEVFNKIA